MQLSKAGTQFDEERDTSVRGLERNDGKSFFTPGGLTANRYLRGMDCTSEQMDLFDARDHLSHAGRAMGSTRARAWLVTASAAEARLIERALGASESLTKPQFLDVSNGQRIIAEDDLVLFKAPGVADATLFVPERLSSYELDRVVAATLAATPLPSGSAADLMFVTFRGAPDLVISGGPQRSRLELLLWHLRTGSVRADTATVMRLCEDALALVEPARAVALSAALWRMHVCGLATEGPCQRRAQVTRERELSARLLRASGRESAALSLERLVARPAATQIEMFPVDDSAARWPRPSLGAVIRRCTAVPLDVDLPGIDLSAAQAGGNPARRQVARLALPKERVSRWLEGHRGNLFVPSVIVSETGKRSRTIAVALTSELSFLLGAWPGNVDGGGGTEWTVIPHSPQGRFEPVASGIRAGCAATFKFDSGGRRISKLYLTLSRPNRPARTLRVPLSHQHCE